MQSLMRRRPLRRVIAGDQTGAEQAALFAAEACGIATGGWYEETNEHGWDGKPLFSMRTRFGLRPHAGGRPDRIRAHVLDSDATLRLGYDFLNTDDEICRRALELLGAEFLDFRLTSLSPTQEVSDWIVTKQIRTLHVTGNQERLEAPFVFIASLVFLIGLFRGLGYSPDECQLRALHVSD